MIAIVDYGAGNLVSVKKAFDWLRQECVVTSDPMLVAKAQKVVLPGVGHFASTASLGLSGLQHAIADTISRVAGRAGSTPNIWFAAASAERTSASASPRAWFMLLME